MSLLAVAACWAAGSLAGVLALRWERLMRGPRRKVLDGSADP